MHAWVWRVCNYSLIVLKQCDYSSWQVDYGQSILYIVVIAIAS